MKNAKEQVKKWLLPINKVCEAYWFPLLFIPIAVVFLLVFSPSTSPLFIYEGVDSAVFKSMGQAILKGKVIYRDIFDNKGPILYLINAIGLAIGGRNGIFLLQTVFFSVALWFMYRTARLFANGLWSLISLVVALLLYTVFLEGGNLCEEWMIYAFTPALYLSMRWCCDLKNDTEKALDKRRMMRNGLLYGLVFAYAFFIRPNDAVSIIGGLVLSVSALTVRHHDAKKLIYLFVGTILGVAIISLPIIVWFATQDALVDLWNGMFGVNFGYVDGSSLVFSMPVAKTPLLLCILTACIVGYCFGGLEMLILTACPMVLSYLLIGHGMFLHYFIVFVPFIVLYVSFLKKVPVPVATIGLLVLLLTQPYSLGRPGAPLIRMARHQFSSRNTSISLNNWQSQLLHEGEILVSYIPMEERDFVWNDLWSNYGLFPIFPHNGMVQCNRPIFYFRENRVYQESVYQSLDALQELPLWVISTTGKKDALLDRADSPYYMMYETEYYTLYRLR